MHRLGAVWRHRRVLEGLGRPGRRRGLCMGGRGLRPSVGPRGWAQGRAGPSCSYPPRSPAWARARGALARIPAQSTATRSRSFILGVGDSQPGPHIGLAPPPPWRPSLALPNPQSVLPAGPVWSGPRAPPPAAAESRSPQPQREKSLIPGGGARAGTRGRLHPPAQRPLPPTPRQIDRCSTPLKAPPPTAPGNPPRSADRAGAVGTAGGGRGPGAEVLAEPAP